MNIIFHSTEHFSVTFRTSQRMNDNGFELSVICFDPINMNKKVCVCVYVCARVYLCARFTCVCTFCIEAN